MLRASYTVQCIVTADPNEGTSAKLFIVDNDVGMTITNDAENVVKDVLSKYPEHRIIYQDTDGNWDELLHQNGEFAGFKPYNN